MTRTYTPREMVDTLIGFDTTSRDSNLHLIEFVAGYLKSHGLSSTLIYDEDKRKANLVATVGPERDGGIVLSGHTDVVPVDGQPWVTDPFVTVEKDGRLFGRGTSDMKSFIAVALAMLPEFQRAGLKSPIHFAFSYDEEVGCFGVHGIVRHIREHGPKPRAIIVGEPTEMQVVDAHKSAVAVRTTVTGLEAHSSATPSGVNAIAYAAQLIGEIERIAEDFTRTDNPHAHRFEPPYDTVSVGTIEGGTASNIIPRRCCFVWGHRALPGNDELAAWRRLDAFAREVLLPKMRKVHPEASIENEVLAICAALSPEPGSEAERLAMVLAGTNRTEAVSYGTEGGIFQQAGIPTVVCGPGNIREAHKPNEFIELSQIDACVGFMRRLSEKMSG